MAYIWGMTVRFRSRADAEEFKTAFDTCPFEVPSGAVKLLVGVDDRENEEAECDILPYRPFLNSPAEEGSRDDFEEYLNGHGGPADDAEVADLTEAGNILYDRLRDAPHTYMYALCGVETSDWLSMADLTERADDVTKRPEAYHGLVLGRDVWEALGSPACFVPFYEGTMWIPWRGPKEGS